MKKRLVLFLAFSSTAFGAVNQSRTSQPPANPIKEHPKWLLAPFIELGAQNPQRLLNLADRLFSDERLRITSVEPTLAFEWQHRLAMASALSELFDQKLKRRSPINAFHREHARKILRHAMEEDPSLLVRDGCVESIRRIVRMQPGERNVWKAPLERAFLSTKNVLGGEGFFIRETILTALRESSLKLSASVRQAALKDKNAQVRNLVNAWRTQAYDEL